MFGGPLTNQLGSKILYVIKRSTVIFLQIQNLTTLESPSDNKGREIRDFDKC